MATFTEAMTPAGPAALDGGPERAAVGGVAECTVYAHESLYGSAVLNVEIDAPEGVTVRVHINDGRYLEITV